MIVDNIKGAGATNDIKKKKKVPSSSGGFASHLNDIGESGSSIAEVASVSSVNSLFMLQEIDEDLGAKKKAVEDSFDAIEYLDKIRVGLLSGAVSEVMLKELESLIGSWRRNFNDPELESVIDDIELRAAVELAKLKGI